MAVQAKVFPRELTTLRRLGAYAADRKQCGKRNLSLKKDSCLYCLHPYVGCDSLIRVGGRIRRASLPRDLAHPVVLPKVSHVTRLVISHHHQQVCHSGRGVTLNEIRASGYWIIKARATVTSYVWNCVKCRKMAAVPISWEPALNLRQLWLK